MDRITLKNFRCFREEQTARLAPLTLLVGENSTGKTSFMAMIRALWHVIHVGDAPDFKEEPYDLGSFDEIAHHRGGKGGWATAFDAGFGSYHKGRNGMKNSTIDDELFRFEVTFKKKGTLPIPVRRHLVYGDTWVGEQIGENQSRQVSFGTPNGAWKFEESNERWTLPNLHHTVPYPILSLLDDVDNAISENIRPSSSIADTDNIELIPLQGVELPCEEDWRFIVPLRDFIRVDLLNHMETPYASAPVRSRPRRTYDPARFTWDPEGDYVPMYLANVYFQDDARWNYLRVTLEKFGQTSGLFDEISVKPLGKKESGPFQVQVRKFGDKIKGPQRNLIDVGYGVSQVLPVITELLRDDTPPMFLLLQQPEVHLHPSAQAALGTLFCETAKPERQLVVETHSDHLLDRVRMDIRDGTTKLRPDDVSILFFERDNLDVKIHSLRLDKEGNILNAPPSYRKFFMEETRRSLGLEKKRKGY